MRGVRRLTVAVGAQLKHMLHSTKFVTYLIGAGLIVTSPLAHSLRAADRQLNTQDLPTTGCFTRGQAGDETSAILDDIIFAARQSGSIVVIVSRLGDGEYSATLNRRRLHNAVARLVWYSTPLPKKQVVAAVGARVKGPGRIEFYVDGRLRYLAEPARGKDFDVDCCDEDPRYYPWYRAKAKIRVDR